jgi:hypothetical protein
LLIKELELQAMLWTLTHTIEAEMALRLMPWNAANRIVATLATQQAAVAVFAVLWVLYQPENRPARHDAQKRAEWAKSAAPEPCHTKIECQKKNKDRAQPDALPEVGLL